jgi:hypothetical protein
MMNLAEPETDAEPPSRPREFRRYKIECRAGIRRSIRHYADYRQNIGRGGAKRRTITTMGGIGKKLLRLSDLPALRPRLVSSRLKLCGRVLAPWTPTRSAMCAHIRLPGIGLEPIG